MSDWLASSFDPPEPAPAAAAAAAATGGGATTATYSACLAAELPSDDGAGASPGAHATAASGAPSAVFTPMSGGWRRLVPGSARTRQGDIALELDGEPQP